MTRTYTETLDLSIGGDEPTWEGEATVSYEVAWGSPESGRFGPPEHYDPGSGDVVEAIKVTHIDGVPVAQRAYGRHEAETLETHIECSDDLLNELLDSAREADAAAYEDAMERRAEEAREERF